MKNKKKPLICDLKSAQGSFLNKTNGVPGI